MNYTVVTTARADRDIDEALSWWTRQSTEVAERWFHGLEQIMQSLATFPKMHARAREDKLGGRDVYQVLYGRYRIVYYVTHETATVVAVRGVGRANIDPNDL